MATAEAHIQPPFLVEDPDGVIHVGGTRIPLERVILEWRAGASPEAIAESFPVLELADVYATVAHYLRHRDQVDAYLKRADEDAERVRAEIEEESPQEGLRERLLARLNR